MGREGVARTCVSAAVVQGDDSCIARELSRVCSSLLPPTVGPARAGCRRVRAGLRLAGTCAATVLVSAGSNAVPDVPHASPSVLVLAGRDGVVRCPARTRASATPLPAGSGAATRPLRVCRRSSLIEGVMTTGGVGDGAAGAGPERSCGVMKLIAIGSDAVLNPARTCWIVV